MIVIQDYQPGWPAEFEVIRATLTGILGPGARRIDHIGSTAIPGLGAKDVIDIQVTVPSLGPALTAKLVAAGYEHRPAVNRDHVPAGENPDPRLWRKLFFREPAAQRRANVHLRIEGNPNQRYAILFRDYLRAHPHAAKSIELIKREIAKRHAEDEEAYYDIKDPVYDLVWDAAKEWAESTGWKV
ncbi:MAG: GrpB family protein [Opitutaceae bacterium]